MVWLRKLKKVLQFEDIANARVQTEVDKEEAVEYSAMDLKVNTAFAQ